MLCMKQLRTPIESHLQMLQVFNLMLCLSQLKLDHSVNLYVCTLGDLFLIFCRSLSLPSQISYRRRKDTDGGRRYSEGAFNSESSAPSTPQAHRRGRAFALGIQMRCVGLI